MVRVGMANPHHILPQLDALITAFKHPRVYKFLHIPIQAGNNIVLKDMRRRYMAEDYEHIVSRFRKEIPEMTIATDIIVGYPTESDVQFNDTLKVIRDSEPDVCNISRFWPRDHTPAAKLKELPGDVVKDRAIKTNQTFLWTAKKHAEKWKNWEGKVRIVEEGKQNTMVARNFAYKHIILKEGKLGDVVKVKVTQVHPYHLFADTI